MLNAGVKKRRLAKEAETQAAASSDQPFCLQLGTGSDQTHMLEATQQHSDQPDLSAVGEQPPSDPGLIHSQPSGHFSSAPTNDVTHMQSMSSGHMSYIEQQECDAHTAGDCSAALMASQDCVADPQQGTCADAAAAMASQHADCSQHQACYAPDPDHLTGQLQGMPSQQDNIDRLSTDQQCIEMHPQPPSLSPTSASHVQQQHQQLPALSLTSAAHSQQQHQQPARQHLQPQSDEEHQYQELEQQQQQQQCEHQQQQYEHCKVKSQQQNSGGVSFDVRGMDLFQQQDTCDAFGSFWRSTSGAQSSQPLAAAEAGPSGQEQARAVAFEGKKACKTCRRSIGFPIYTDVGLIATSPSSPKIQALHDAHNKCRALVTISELVPDVVTATSTLYVTRLLFIQ